MSSTVLRREGDTVHVEHKYYGRFKFRESAAPLSDAGSASALVFAGERTDGGEPARIAVKFDTGNQVYADHMHWRDLYYNPATRFAGLPWVLAQTIPEAPWRGAKVDVMISELLGDSLETVRLRSAQRTLPPRAVCCVAIQTLEMLAAMHAAGVVHRDIKPANLLARLLGCSEYTQPLLTLAQLPLERAGPQQLHVIDFGIAGKIDARGASAGQNADGTALYSHAGAALRCPVTFRDDLEAAGYTLLALAAGRLPWEALALAALPKKAQEKRGRDVAALKRSALAPALQALACAPLAAALRAYFDALRLQAPADNAARFDYAQLRAPFCAAYALLAGSAYAGPRLDLDDVADAADGTAPAPDAGAGTGCKRKAADAGAGAKSKRARAAPQPPTRKSTRRA